MNFLDLIKNIFTEERNIPEGKKHLLLLDIDDTLLRAKSNMKIYRKLPSDKEEVALTPEQYAKENVTPDLKKYYDYRDFRDPKKVYESIVKGAPYINNLKALDDFYNAGADIGILTARGCEDIVYKAIKAFLRVRDKNGNLVKPNLPRERVHGVNDEIKHYPGDTDGEKKKNVIRSYYNKYDYITLFDDDVKNIKNALSLKKVDPEAVNKVRTIDGAKNRGKASELSESLIYEMAVKDVTSEIIDAINNKDYKKALISYFNIIKSQESYKGKKDAVSAIKHMIAFGVPRTFAAFEKKGSIPSGSAAELKEFGLKHLNDLADSVDYESNPDYVAPKRNLTTTRKKLVANTSKELEDLIKQHKSEGWVFKDETPKQGNNKTRGEYFYVYAVKSNNSINEEVLEEMAVKDVTETIRKNIKNGNFKDALVEYLKAIKNLPTYASLDLGGAYDKMRSYGLSRTFKAEENANRIPAGSTKALKDFAGVGENRDAILSVLKGSDVDTPAETKKKEKAEKNEKDETYDDGPSGTLKKIENRIKKYSDLAKELEDYALTSPSISAFVVRNGSTNATAPKPKLSDFDIKNPLLTKSERYILPMKEFRTKFVPSFIEKKAMADIPVHVKKDLNKAETMGSEYYEATKNRYLAHYMKILLNNIVLAFYEFKKENKGENVTDEEFLKKLSENIDFPYEDFVELEKWMKNARIKFDKARFEDKSSESTKKAAKVPKEVDKVRTEYITYLNELEKAIADDKIGEFISNNDNWSIAYAILSPETNAIVSASDMKKFLSGKVTPSNELLPSLKAVYKNRFDENKEPDFQKNYQSVQNAMGKLRTERINAVRNGEDTSRIDRSLEALAKTLINSTMDRLIAVDLVTGAAGTPVLDNFKEAARRHEEIKKRALETNSKLSKKEFNEKDPKYDKYYTPEIVKRVSTPDKMYDEVIKACRSLSKQEQIDRNIYIPIFLNLETRRYLDNEIKELYDILIDGGKEKLFSALASEKFKGRRPVRYE